jgi:hypothetical protein
MARQWREAEIRNALDAGKSYSRDFEAIGDVD